MQTFTLRAVLASALLWCWALEAVADIVINTTQYGDDGYQMFPSVAANSSGQMFVVWIDGFTDVPSHRNAQIKAQRLTTEGTFVGSEFRIDTAANTPPSINGTGVAGAINDSGNMVAAWAGIDGSNYGILARRYSSSGAPLTAPITINQNTAGMQRYPDVGIYDNNSFAVTWQSTHSTTDGKYDVYARWFDNLGQPLTTDVQINSTATGEWYTQQHVALSASGRSIFGWNKQGADSRHVYARFYDSLGTAIGPEFQVDSAYPGGISDVMINSSGESVVLWQAVSATGDGYSLYGSRFDASSAPIGSEFHIADGTFSNMGAAGAMDDLGRLLVVWQSKDSLDHFNVFAKVLSADTSILMDTFQLNTGLDAMQPRVGLDASGRALAAWTGNDAYRRGVLGQTVQVVPEPSTIAVWASICGLCLLFFAPRGRHWLGRSGRGCELPLPPALRRT